VPVTVDLPAEAIQRLEAEAARRGVSIDVLIADLAASLPAANTTPRRNPAFVAIGASERGATDRFEETLAEGFGRD